MHLRLESIGHGPDVVLLHGWGLHGGVFARVADRLARDYCLHLVDLPGHGASNALDDYSGAAVVDALQALFPMPVHVLGWSLGGLIAQYWALQQPAAVRSLALVATSPCFVRKADWPHAQAADTILAVANSLDDQFEQTLNRFLALQTLGSSTAKNTLADLQTQLFSHGRPQGLLPALQLLLTADLRPAMSSIACPVGLFFGQRDMITPPGVGQWLAGQLAWATLHIFPQASHAPFLSHEDEFCERLYHHLDSCA